MTPRQQIPQTKMKLQSVDALKKIPLILNYHRSKPTKEDYSFFLKKILLKKKYFNAFSWMRTMI